MLPAFCGLIAVAGCCDGTMDCKVVVVTITRICILIALLGVFSEGFSLEQVPQEQAIKEESVHKQLAPLNCGPDYVNFQLQAAANSGETIRFYNDVAST